jgi:translation initiation factor IF-2
MRKRGARVTDLIVLIVSATEGVKRQTQEVIDLIIKDQIPTIVAINKIDLPHADVEGVEDSLFEAGLSIEPKGGNIPVIHISAKTGQNVDLLSGLILEETSDLKAFTSGQAEAIVLEAYQTEKGLNAMTLIVKQGILNNGSILIIGD